MGYSPWKINSLGQKLKMPKRCEKRSYDHSGVVVSEKAPQKTPNTKKERILRMAKIGHHTWVIAHGKLTVWVKN